MKSSLISASLPAAEIFAKYLAAGIDNAEVNDSFGFLRKYQSICDKLCCAHSMFLHQVLLSREYSILAVSFRCLNIIN